ncbi:MAG: iron-sulfur cluster repair di-iron protein [Bacteroidetes bacterium]|nr:iron-sulfur cluster repair di-iron protein [Bacteroidota bacterium]
MVINENQSVGEIVALNYRTASLFKKHGIDFCCNGNQTINQACQNKSINTEIILRELNEVSKEISKNTVDFNSWPLDLLADYIEKKHHRYVKDIILEILPYLNKVCKVHGEQHPELVKIQSEFNSVAEELVNHMQKEESILFPVIRNMVKTKQNNFNLEQAHFRTIQNPIQMMMAEHITEGERFRRIEQLSKNYTVPHDACNTYIVSYELLKEFEEDLHLHIHLENNILFPKAILLEEDLLKKNS